MQERNPVDKQIIAEQRKEIARLQKRLAKLEVRKDSEIAALKAKIAEKKASKVIVVTGVPDRGAP
jgi:BMFP domain-containing protein YqiC